MFLLLLSTKPLYGCVGARPLGMGGAFISVADDVNSLYWNPAGVAIAEEGITYSPTVTSPDQMGYRHFFGINRKVDEQGVGFSYIQRIRPWDDIVEDWYVLSMALKVKDGLFMGFNYRYKEDELARYYHQQDLGVLWRNNEGFSAGILYQSLNNLRMGISYRIDDNFLLAADIYDVLGYKRYMFGSEYSLDDNFDVRIGVYNKDFTLGFGYEFNRISFDIATMFRDSNIIKTSISYNF